MDYLLGLCSILVLFCICALVGWTFWKIYDWRWRKLEEKERATHPDFFDRETNYRLLNKRRASFLTQEAETKKQIALLQEEANYTPRARKYELELEIDRLCWSLRDLEIKRKKIDGKMRAEKKYLDTYRESWKLKT